MLLQEDHVGIQLLLTYKLGHFHTIHPQEGLPLLAKPFQTFPFLHNQIIKSPLKSLHRNHNFFKITVKVVDNNLYMFGLPINLGVKRSLLSKEKPCSLTSGSSRHAICITYVLSQQDIYFLVLVSYVIIKVDTTNNILCL